MPLATNVAIGITSKEKYFTTAYKGCGLGNVFTFDENGNLKGITDKEKPSFEKTVRAWRGDRPLSFVVITELHDIRFTLCAENLPDEVFQAVVGVKMEEAETKAASRLLDDTKTARR